MEFGDTCFDDDSGGTFHLRLVKELCEDKESCKIIPSQILAQHAKCQKVGRVLKKDNNEDK